MTKDGSGVTSGSVGLGKRGTRERASSPAARVAGAERERERERKRCV